LVMQFLVNGQVNGRVWNQIQCVAQPSSQRVSNPQIALGGTAGWSAGAGNNTMQANCDIVGVDSNGNPTYDCSAQAAQCAAVTGTATINSAGNTLTCSPASGGPGVSGGTTQCYTNNGACSVAALMAAGLSSQQANIMSCIAMTESSGIASTPPYNVTHPGSNSSACGTFQITRTTWNRYATGACANHATSCQNAQCNMQVAAQLVQSNGYRDWTCPNCNSRAQGCINAYP
ncbi:hypothetical protein KC887_09395, partial [Candidatus Kaiserbacteria bacterium]|nr:hypothetical protein [Candidatus Kaiserbacteria bacterium]